MLEALAMFHRQSVCGLILGLTLVIFAGVFRPAEGITGKISDTEASKEVAIEIASGAESTEASQDGNAPGQSTSRPTGEAPGNLP